jgi:hypothetical protein
MSPLLSKVRPVIPAKPLANGVTVLPSSDTLNMFVLSAMKILFDASMAIDSGVNVLPPFAALSAGPAKSDGKAFGGYAPYGVVEYVAHIGVSLRIVG